MNSSLETSRPADGHDKLEHGPAVSLGPVENSEQADWDLSEQESQPGGEAAGSRPSGMVLAQLETEGQFAAVTEKAGPENADGGRSTEVPAQGGDRDVSSPAEPADPAKPDADVTGVVMSGPVPAPAEFPRRADSPKFIDTRRHPATLAIESDRPTPVASSTQQAGRPHRPVTPAAPVLPAAVSDDSPTPGQAVAESIAAAKVPAAADRPVNPVMAQDPDPGALPQSSVTEALRDKASTRIVPQAETAFIRANVLPGNPMSHSPGQPTARPARKTPIDALPAPQVKIGQVDVFIEAPHRSNKPRPSSPPASHSLASRHYLRRL
jgi:hypothetical protein